MQGFILEDFPKTRQQAVLLARKGIVPSNVFYLRGNVEQSYDRTEAIKREKFSADRMILSQRIRHFLSNMPNVLSFYQRYYNNVQEIDALKSKWFMEDRALFSMEVFLKAR